MWPNPQETADLVTFAEEILNAKFHFLCSVEFVCFRLQIRWDPVFLYATVPIVILSISRDKRNKL